jgi:type II secretory pathway predicted ATPase ExeA
MCWLLPAAAVSAAPVVVWQLQLLSLNERPAALVRHVVDDKHSTRKLHLLVVAVVRLQNPSSTSSNTACSTEVMSHLLGERSHTAI